MEDTLDLELSNYDFNDLVILFKLNKNFTQEELKEAKNIVYALHPDKSNLNKEYFIFFLNAYKLLLKVAEFRFKNKNNNEYDLDFNSIKEEYFNETEKKLAKEFTSHENFNKRFNELFDKHGNNIKDEGVGHGEWLKSSEDMNDSYESRKEKSRSLSIKSNLETYNFHNTNNYGLLGSNINNGGSDLKDVYTINSVIGVSEKDLDNMQRCKSVEELKQERSIKTDPLNDMLSKEYFKNKQEEEDTETSKRVYDLIVEEENNIKNKDTFWANLKQLRN